MNKLLFKFIVILFSSIIFSIFIILLPPTKVEKKSLLAAINDKNRLLETTKKPRIILIGGSNLSFGLNSRIIVDSLNLNPINTGIHACLGLKYMLNNAKQYIKENDIIVISPEYEQFYNDLGNGRIELLITVLDIYPESLKLLDKIQIINLLKYLPKFLNSKLNNLINYETFDIDSIGAYDKLSFNSYGDASIHWTLPKKKIKPFGSYSGKFNENILQSLLDFSKVIESKNAKLFITFPCYQDQSFDNAFAQIKKVEKRLIENKFTLLGTPERYKMDDSLFFDTPFHLTRQGVDLRTSLLIEDLKRAGF